MSRLIHEKLLITEVNPKSHISEAYRSLRTNIQYSAIDCIIQTILVTSAQPGEGKSTTIANLAIVYAQEGKRVLIIDGDLRKPSIHRMFGLSNRIGLTSILLNEHPLSEAVNDSYIENLQIITSGPIPPNPAEALSSKRMNAVLEELKLQFDIILIDSPPVIAVTDAQILATKTDGVVLIVHSGKAKAPLVKKAKADLDHVKARILGVVLNNHERNDSETYGYNYYGI